MGAASATVVTFLVVAVLVVVSVVVVEVAVLVVVLSVVVVVVAVLDVVLRVVVVVVVVLVVVLSVDVIEVAVLDVVLSVVVVVAELVVVVTSVLQSAPLHPDVHTQLPLLLLHTPLPQLLPHVIIDSIFGAPASQTALVPNFSCTRVSVRTDAGRTPMWFGGRGRCVMGGCQQWADKSLGATEMRHQTKVQHTSCNGISE